MPPEAAPAQMLTPAELEGLAARGVRMTAPHLVAIARDVPLEAIAPGTVLHPFSRLEGALTRVDAGAVIGAGGAVTLQDTWVGPDAMVGTLGPVTLRDVTVGPRCDLGCGVAESSVFLGREAPGDGFTTGYGFRVRKGTLYEEDANSAQHTDTKMTILFPWVTLGSNINWCDILVAGGTGPQPGSFSEIGSGAIHFNFTPRGDKATGTLLGNVTDGVFLDCERVFIGGNTSVVGPLRGAFGAVAPAGVRLQHALRPGLNPGLPLPQKPAPFDLEVHGAIDRILASQVRMVGELAALDAWYGFVREPLTQGDLVRMELYARGRAVVRDNLRERIAQLDGLAGRIERSVSLLEQRNISDIRLAQQRAFLALWPELERHLAGYERAQEPPPTEFLEALEAQVDRTPGRYTDIIQGLHLEAAEIGKHWLKGIAQRVASEALLGAIPARDGAAAPER